MGWVRVRGRSDIRRAAQLARKGGGLLLNADQLLGHLHFSEQIQPFQYIPRSSELACVRQRIHLQPPTGSSEQSVRC